MSERAHYKEISPVPGALTTWSLSHDPNNKNKGIKHKTGRLSLSYDKEEELYTAFIVLDVIPEVNL
jgi:hypothetical protein